MNMVTGKDLRQRADYTYKFNVDTERHGWLRLTPAYSAKVVEDIIGRYTDPARVLDPFCGTATTALTAAYHGHGSVTTEINPFLVWFGQTKTAQYSDAVIASTHGACGRVIESLKYGRVEPKKAPPIHNIERWWTEEALEFLCALMSGIEVESRENSPERSLLLVAFCRTLIGISNAAFNHQSTAVPRNPRADVITYCFS